MYEWDDTSSLGVLIWMGNVYGRRRRYVSIPDATTVQGRDGPNHGQLTPPIAGVAVRHTPPDQVGNPGNQAGARWVAWPLPTLQIV